MDEYFNKDAFYYDINYSNTTNCIIILQVLRSVWLLEDGGRPPKHVAVD